MECKKYVNKTYKQKKKKRKAIKCYKCKNANLHLHLFYKNKPLSKKIVVYNKERKAKSAYGFFVGIILRSVNLFGYNRHSAQKQTPLFLLPKMNGKN